MRSTRLLTGLLCCGLLAGLLWASAGLAAAAEPCGTYSGRGCAPDSQRVDLATPSFSNPTRIDNPLFPIANLHSVVFLGREDGHPFRSETTLLPGTGAVTL